MTTTNCPSEAALRLVRTEAVDDATFAGLEGDVEPCFDRRKVLEAAMNTVPQTTDLAPGWAPRPTLPGLVVLGTLAMTMAAGVAGLFVLSDRAQAERERLGEA